MSVLHYQGAGRGVGGGARRDAIEVVVRLNLKAVLLVQLVVDLPEITLG